MLGVAPIPLAQRQDPGELGMSISTFIATTGHGLARATRGKRGAWHVETLLSGTRVHALAHDGDTVYAGTADGVLRSDDRGRTWNTLGLHGLPIRSLATTRAQPGRVVAGSRPPALFISDDRGEIWHELEAFRETRRWWWFTPTSRPFREPYVLSLTLSPTDPDAIVAGIEYGAVLRSGDGGLTWSGHLRGANRDSHYLAHNPLHGEWVYQGGGTGAALSMDGGITWRGFKAANPVAALLEGFGKATPHDGLDRHYGWAAGGDPDEPNVWYFAASFGPSYAHGSDGNAQARIYRCRDGRTFEALSGGLPDPLPHMPYAFITDVDQAGHVYAGMSNGDIWHSEDLGDTWTQLALNLSGIHRQLIGF
jgi:hypothetical protein